MVSREPREARERRKGKTKRRFFPASPHSLLVSFPNLHNIKGVLYKKNIFFCKTTLSNSFDTTLKDFALKSHLSIYSTVERLSRCSRESFSALLKDFRTLGIRPLTALIYTKPPIILSSKISFNTGRTWLSYINEDDRWSLLEEKEGDATIKRKRKIAKDEKLRPLSYHYYHSSRDLIVPVTNLFIEKSFKVDEKSERESISWS